MTETSGSITFLNHHRYHISNTLHSSVGFTPSYMLIKISRHGEILVKVDNVFKGSIQVINNKNIIIKHNQWFNTGDLGYVHEDTGAFFIHGRKFDVIKTGVENVFAPKVEQHLLSHDYVMGAAVVGIPDETFGTAVSAAVCLHDRNNDEQLLKRLHKDCESISRI